VPLFLPAYGRWLLALTALGCGSALRAQNLVTDGDFEAPDLSAWTLTAENPPPSTSLDTRPSDAHGGNNSVSFFESGSFDTLSQNVATVAGHSYSLSFWLATNTDFSNPAQLGGSEEFQVLWNGQVVYDSNTLEISPYTQDTNTSPMDASGSSSLLSFRVRNDPDAYYLDDVAVTDLSGPVVVPEAGTWMTAGLVAGWLVAFRLIRRKPVCLRG
jgi:hypothetical protein